MTLRAVFSFDIYPNAPQPEELARKLREAVGQRKLWRILSRVWAIAFKDEGDFRQFALALRSLHDQQGHGDVFDYFALLWHVGSSDVLVAERSRPLSTTRSTASAAPGLLEKADVETVDTLFNLLENSRELRAFSTDGDTRHVVPVVLSISTEARPVAAQPPPGGRRKSGGPRRGGSGR
jgi:hypothetical protein